jgi:hypothetical protein
VSGNINERVEHDQTLPSFVSFTFPDYIFNPSKIEDLGIFLIKGKLWNQYASTEFFFKVNVTNSAPYFSGDSLKK